MKLEKILTTILLTIIPGIAMSEELIILNTGSETGSFAQETIALFTDFENLEYDVDFRNPGNHCLAIELARTITDPLLMPWASDYEAGGRSGNDCVSYEFKAENIIRYNRTSLQMCTVNNNVDAFANTSGLIGITPAWQIQERAVNVINNFFNVKHRAIKYNGSGDLKTALFNGEVEYAILSPKHAADVVNFGGHCFYSLGNNLPDMPSLPELVNSEDSRYLYLGWDTVFLALNMSVDQINSLREQLIDIHNKKGFTNSFKLMFKTVSFRTVMLSTCCITQLPGDAILGLVSRFKLYSKSFAVTRRVESLPNS
jgi:hypothetical protein